MFYNKINPSPRTCPLQRRSLVKEVPSPKRFPLERGSHWKEVPRRHSSIRFLAPIKGYTCLGSCPAWFIFRTCDESFTGLVESVDEILRVSQRPVDPVGLHIILPASALGKLQGSQGHCLKQLGARSGVQVNLLQVPGHLLHCRGSQEGLLNVVKYVVGVLGPKSPECPAPADAHKSWQPRFVLCRVPCRAGDTVTPGTRPVQGGARVYGRANV